MIKIQLTLTVCATIATTIAATLLSTSAIARAENPAHVKQLLETGQCPSCNLANADLTGAHLIGADLRNANLTGANLTGANLEGADLTGATLVDANLQRAYFTHADLRWANMTRTNQQSGQFWAGSGEESYPRLKVQSYNKRDCSMDSLQNILTDALATVGHFTNRNGLFYSHS